MSSILSGKKILFFCPQTFGYEKAIMNELKSMGAQVVYHSDRPVEHPWIIGLLRINPRFAWNLADVIYDAWLKKLKIRKFDYVFIIKGEGISLKTILRLRSIYPEATFILYLWDNISNVMYTDRKLKYFDRCFSFDPHDCKKYEMFKYRPLFFLNNYVGDTLQSINKDIFFIGTLNGDRPRVISRINDCLEKGLSFDYWLFVRSKLELYLRKIIDKSLRKIDSKRLLFKPMPASDIKSRFNECQAILDVEHPKQSGLTMRTFEVLVSGKKLITTNKSIMNHDFYDPSRICVIDREKPTISKSFLKSKLDNLPNDFLLKYSLRGWLLDIFNS